MTDATATLVRLGDTELTLADGADDIRDRTVFDRNGDEIGRIDGLIIDEDERRVRFLQVASGGFLGRANRGCSYPSMPSPASTTTMSTSTRTAGWSRTDRSTTPT